MTDAGQPPPTPGSSPLLRRGDPPTLRPFREDPAIAARERASGRLAHSEGERRARVDAVAHDLAAGASWPSDGPLRPALPRELLAVARRNVATAVAAEADLRADATRVRDEGELAQALAQRRHERTIRELRRTRSEQLMAEPVGGTRLTGWGVLWIIAPVLCFLELKLGSPTLRAALETDTATADRVALAIALALTFAAEATGLVFGGLLRPSLRATRIAYVLVVLLVAGCAAWSVLALVGGREHNKRYSNAVAAIGNAQTGAGAGADGGGLAGLVKSAAATGAGSTQAVKPQVSKADLATIRRGPDFGFMVPLTLLAMLTGMVLAMRVALAREWRERRRRAVAAEREEAAAVEHLDAMQQAVAAAEQPLQASDARLATLADAEVDTLDLLLARLRSEYERQCQRCGVEPRELVIPDAPEPDEVLARAIREYTPVERPPEEPPGAAEAPPAEAEPEPEPEPEPEFPFTPWDETEAEDPIEEPDERAGGAPPGWSSAPAVEPDLVAQPAGEGTAVGNGSHAGMGHDEEDA